MLMHNMMLASYVESQDELADTELLLSSLRTFGGKMRHLPIHLFAPTSEKLNLSTVLSDAGVTLTGVDVPEDIAWLYYAGKPLAAAVAEKTAVESHELLVWLDSDTIVVDEPSDFDLRYLKALAYKPVMHNRAGSLFDEEVSPYWRRVFELAEIDESRLFPMHSQADHQRIRPFFQAGCLVVRPELGIMQRWSDDFIKVASDPTLAEMCREERVHRVFLHQAALVGAIVNNLDRDQLLELSDAYNYPLLFERGYESKFVFNDLQGVVTLRRVVPKEKLSDDWQFHVSGPPEKIAWLRENVR